MSFVSVVMKSFLFHHDVPLLDTPIRIWLSQSVRVVMNLVISIQIITLALSDKKCTYYFIIWCTTVTCQNCCCELHDTA